MQNLKPFKPMKLRYALIAMLSLVSLGAIVTPASAATGLARLDGGALAAIIAFGALLFAIVFEVWRMTLRSTAPARNRATHDWSPGAFDH